jgi:phosphatidate cytidylyltransferase
MRNASAATGELLPAKAPVRLDSRELTTRLVSAVVLGVVASSLMLIGGWPFAILVTLFAAGAFWEWTGVTGAAEPIWLRGGTLACLAAGLLMIAFMQTDWAIALIGFPALLTLAAGLFRRSALWMGLGLLYVAVPCAALIILRQAEPWGWIALLFIVAIVWATDTAAFFAGRRFGGPKLWPRVSPKKTWSGAVAGLAAGTLAGGAVAIGADLGWILPALPIAVLLSLATQGGDLLESAVKRRFGVKDASQIIPGHGGVLDRVDGLFAAAALAWLIAGIGLGGGILSLPAEIAVLSQGAS